MAILAAMERWMPLRAMDREQMWLMPPSLGDLIPAEHPSRFVAEVVDALDREDWAELGVEIDGGDLGPPSYHPRALLSVWLYGFMTGIRSCRKLEAACRDQIPYLWLTCVQYPDHNTLWRFYKSHRQAMRRLFKRTVRMAVKMELVDLALQAVDGTKVGANASKARTYDAEGLGRLLERLERAISDLESQNESGEDAPTAQLPQELYDKRVLREQVRQAMDDLSNEEGRRINLTDREARLMKTRQGVMPGYNAQAMASPARTADGQRAGMLITAVEVVDEPGDHGQLTPMLDKAEDNTGARADMTLADAGYHSGQALEECASRGHRVAMPESQRRALRRPYHKDRFTYDESSDSYRCPQGQALRFIRIKRNHGVPMRRYRASGAVCRACPAFGTCTKDARYGRALEIGPHDAALRVHREWMSTEEASRSYERRQGLIEPVFGIIKDQQAGRRFLLRGIANVAAEWTLLATAFNLRTLWRIWRAGADMWRHGRTSWTATSARIWGCQDRQTAILPAHGLP